MEFAAGEAEKGSYSKACPRGSYLRAWQQRCPKVQNCTCSGQTLEMPSEAEGWGRKWKHGGNFILPEAQQKQTLALPPCATLDSAIEHPDCAVLWDLCSPLQLPPASPLQKNLKAACSYLAGALSQVHGVVSVALCHPVLGVQAQPAPKHNMLLWPCTHSKSLGIPLGTSGDLPRSSCKPSCLCFDHLIGCVFALATHQHLPFLFVVFSSEQPGCLGPLWNCSLLIL